MALENYTNTQLSAVTSATNGSAVDVSDWIEKTAWITVSSNTGAVTVTVQASNDGTTWYDIDEKTYTSSNENDVFTYASYFDYMRIKTSTQSNSTVTATLTGRGN